MLELFKNFTFFVACFVSYSGLLAQSNPDGLLHKISNEEQESLWHFETETRQLFAFNNVTSKVEEYDYVTGKKLWVEGVSKPKSLVVKKGRLVVLCESELVIIDLKLQKIVAEIPIRLSRPVLFKLKASTPFVYLIGRSRELGQVVFQYDVEKLQKTGSREKKSWPESSPLRADDSKMDVLKLHDSGQWLLIDIDEKDLKVNRFVIVGSRDQSYLVLPPAFVYEKYLLMGNTVRELGKSEKSARTLNARTNIVHSKLDWKAGWSMDYSREEKAFESKIKIANFTGENVVSEFEIKHASNNHDPDVRANPFAPLGQGVFLDEERQLLIVTADQHCFVYNVAMSLQDAPPVLEFDVPSLLAAQIGKQVRIPLNLINAELAKDVDFRLSKTVDGVVLDKQNKTLEWTPTADQSGSQAIEVTANEGNRVATLKIQVHVAARNIKLRNDFQPEGMRLSRSGKYGVVWSSNHQEFNDREQESGQESNFAIFDVSKQTALLQQTTKKPIRQMWIDDNYFYTAFGEDSLLYRCEISNPKNRKRLFFDQPIRSILTMSKNEIVAITGDDYKKRNIVSIDYASFTHNKKSRSNAKIPRSLMGEIPYRSLNVSKEHVQNGSRIVDRATGEIVCLIAAPGLDELLSSRSSPEWRIDPGDNLFSHHSASGACKSWGRIVDRGTVKNVAGSRIGTAFSGVSTVSQDYPVGVAVIEKAEKDEVFWSRGKLKHSLGFFDLVEGQKQLVVVIDEQDVSLNSGNHSQRIRKRPLVNTHNESVVIGFLGKLYFVDIPAKLKKLPAPVYFEYPKIKPLDLAKTARIPLVAKGGKGDYEFIEKRELPGFAIENSQLLVNGPEFVKGVMKFFIDKKRVSAKGMKDILHFKIKPDQYSLTTGYKPPADSWAFSVTVILEVRDQEGQFDRMKLAIPLTIGKSELASLAKEMTLEAFPDFEEKKSADNEKNSSKESTKKRTTNATKKDSPKVANPVTKPAVKLPRVVTSIKKLKDRGIVFDGKAVVETNSLHNPKKPLLCEFWITPTRADVRQTICGNQSGNYGIKLGISVRGYLVAQAGTGKQINVVMGKQTLKMGELNHVAIYSYGKELSVYQDGKLQIQTREFLSPLISSSKKFLIGASLLPGRRRYNERFYGVIHAAKFSSPEKIGQQIQPEQDFIQDADTIAIWNFDEGVGEKSKNHADDKPGYARFYGAKWHDGKTPSVISHSRPVLHDLAKIDSKKLTLFPLIKGCELFRNSDETITQFVGPRLTRKLKFDLLQQVKGKPIAIDVPVSKQGLVYFACQAEDANKNPNCTKRSGNFFTDSNGNIYFLYSLAVYKQGTISIPPFDKETGTIVLIPK